MSEASKTYWGKCSTCKKTINFDSLYYVCSVSSCNRKTGGFRFCSVGCFEAHVPLMRHRDAGAFEERSPTQAQFQKMQEAEKEGRRVVRPKSTAAEAEILVVASKIKALIKFNEADMNVSSSLMHALSDWVRYYCAGAIKNAEAANRKTVMDRDIPQ